LFNSAFGRHVFRPDLLGERWDLLSLSLFFFFFSFPSLRPPSFPLRCQCVNWQLCLPCRGGGAGFSPLCTRAPSVLSCGALSEQMHLWSSPPPLARRHPGSLSRSSPRRADPLIPRTGLQAAGGGRPVCVEDPAAAPRARRAAEPAWGGAAGKESRSGWEETGRARGSGRERPGETRAERAGERARDARTAQARADECSRLHILRAAPQSLQLFTRELCPGTAWTTSRAIGREAPKRYRPESESAGRAGWRKPEAEQMEEQCLPKKTLC
jgi:hypothetical protein